MKMYQMYPGTVLVWEELYVMFGLLGQPCIRHPRERTTYGYLLLTGQNFGSRTHSRVELLRCRRARRQVDCLRFGVLVRSFVREE